jgi:integrase
MGATAKIRVRKPARADGTSHVRLQVVLDREIIFVTLGISWPATLVDEKSGECLTKLPKVEQGPDYLDAIATAKKKYGTEWEKRAEEFTLMCGKALGKTNKIFAYAHLNDIALGKEVFLKEYETTASKGDFLLFMETQIAERLSLKEIGIHTWKNNRSTLNSLKRFRSRIPFNSITNRFADEYDAWLKRTGMDNANSRWGRHKDVEKYLNLALASRIRFENPYEHFKNRPGESSWKPLTPDELAKLEAYYPLCAVGSAQRRILQKFLFSCYSSLRLGDLNLLHLARLQGNDLYIKHQKSQRFHKKENVVPLTDRAMMYWQHGREESSGLGFFHYADQFSNRKLQEIGRVLGIETKLHFHVGRETFATNYMRDGGNVTNLMSIMGHSKITMTMRYVHTDDDMKRADIEKLNQVQKARLSEKP